MWVGWLIFPYVTNGLCADMLALAALLAWECLGRNN